MYYIDDDGLISGAKEALEQAFSGSRVELRTEAELDPLRAEVAEDESKSIVRVTEKDDAPFLGITTKSFMSGIDAETVAEVLSQVYIAQVLTAQGIAPETIAFAQSSLGYSADIAGNMDLSGYVLGIVLTLLMFFAVYYYGYGVSMSVATEKTSRVMETLVVSCKPSRILIGKCLAMGALGLMQFVGMIVFAAVCYKLLIPGDFTIMGMPLSISAMTLPSALLIVLYFLLGYALYAVMNAACGAMVSKVEDLNSAMMPVTLIAMVSFYAGYICAIAPTTGVLQKVAMYIPFCAPFIVPFKLLNSDVAATDILISVALLVVAIVIIASVSMRIYSSSVLRYGKRLKLKEAYRQR